MIGTLVNTAAVVLGALIGLLLKKGIPERINNAIIKVEGIAICIIALNGILVSMFTVADGRLKDDGGLLLLISLVLGCVLGEAVRLSDRLDQFGRFIESKFRASNFARGFVNTSLIICIGAMAIIGALNDGLTGDSSVLFMKAAIDFITCIVLAASLGIGVAFAAIPVFLLQGGVALLAKQLAPFLTDPLLNSICMVGYTLVLLIGINFLLDTKIKVANVLPAMAVPVIYHLAILPLFG
ncbi:DUF554 domain-containing protein [Oscillospiraceae bacterium OttesenSCG-928-G22]|nr:DUF554 domain-containing protein [Oscillospiraceae bacterium OttesenSCG-928-G22]